MWNPFSRQSGPDGSTLNNGGRERRIEPVRAGGGPTQPIHSSKIAEVQRIGPTAVATVTVTELTQEHGAELLSELLQELGDTGATHFVLDIQNVQFMDSACLGCLVQALNRMAKSGGRIALANTANSVQYLFRMTQLDRVFSICGDVMSALAAVERERRS